MSLKLTSGFCRGLSLELPASGTRPTAGRVRAAVWNSLQLWLPQARILDICAGTGAVGIEALSRGAAFAAFIERDQACLPILRRNLDEVQRRATQQAIKIAIQVLGLPAEQALLQCQTASFDILWLDPPFAQTCSLLAVLSPELRRIIRTEGVLLVESDSSDLTAVGELLGGAGWTLIKQKSYGKIGISFLSLRAETLPAT